MNKTSTNGGAKFNSATEFQGKEIEFPVTYNLKAVLPAKNDDEINRKKLENVLVQNKITYSFLHKNVSSKGTYASYAYEVTLKSKVQMDGLYSELKKIEDLKFAV